MKQLSLKHLSIRNFKGIQHLEVPITQLTTIKGGNATGKTTVYDAMTYLLFGKDSLGRSDFEIQPLDEKGQVIHHLTTEVEAVFEWEGRERVLRKVLTEKWQRPIGEQTSVYKGTTTSTFIDEVPQKQKEYNAFIGSIMDEKIFRLLTQPFAFEQLPWREKRALLFELGGDLTDQEVIASSEKLKGLSKLLGLRTIEDFKKVTFQKKKLLKEEMNLLPARIDELRGVSCEIDASAYQQALLREEMALGEIESALEAGEETVTACQDKTRQLMAAEKQLEALKKQATEKEQAALALQKERQLQLTARQDRLKAELKQLTEEKAHTQGEISSNNGLIDEGVKRLKALKEEWQQEKEKVFSLDPSERFCPHCGQALPASQLEKLTEQAKSCFEGSKAHHLKTLEEENAREKLYMDRLCERNIVCAKDLSKLEEAQRQHQEEALENAKELEALVKAIALAEERVQKISRFFDEKEKGQEEAKATQESEQDAKLIQQKEALCQEIQSLEQQLSRLTKLDIGALKQQKRLQQGKVDELKKVLAQAAVYEKNKQRIAELYKMQEDKMKAYNKLEQQELLVQAFMRTKVNLLEEKINSHFSYVTFKLFEEQVNGGLAECCESQIHGVPFSSANHAAQLNAGLDIINALIQHYGFAAPIFIDNAESVNEWLPSRGQIIRLLVTKDAALTYEG